MSTVQEPNPYLSALLLGIISQKSKGNYYLTVKERKDFGGKAGTSESVLSKWFASGTMGIGEEARTVIIKTLSEKYHDNDALLLIYEDWSEFEMKELAVIDNREDRDYVRKLSSNTWLPENEEREERIKALVRRRITLLKTLLQEKPLKQSQTVITDIGTAQWDLAHVHMERQGPKREGIDEALLMKLVLKFGFFLDDLAAANLEAVYALEEQRLLDLISETFTEWTLRIQPNAYSGALKVNGLSYCRLPIHGGSFCQVRYIYDHRGPGIGDPNYNIQTIALAINGIGKIRQLIFAVPKSFVNAYLPLLHTLHEFIDRTYETFEGRVLAEFEGVRKHLIDGIYQEMARETERQCKDENLHLKYFLTVTQIVSAGNGISAYHVNRIVIGNILDKLKNAYFQEFGVFELLLKFLAQDFPDEVWRKYGDGLFEGYYTPFDQLADMHQLNPTAYAIVYTERLLHSDENLYCKTLCEYNGLILELNASGNHKESFDRIVASLQPLIEDLFRRNVDLNVKRSSAVLSLSLPHGPQ